jgi:hypothetical protein
MQVMPATALKTTEVLHVAGKRDHLFYALRDYRSSWGGVYPSCPVLDSFNAARENRSHCTASQSSSVLTESEGLLSAIGCGRRMKLKCQAPPK